MISGIFIFEQGGVQQIGDINSLAGIINTIEKILPDLKAQEANRVLEQVPDDELERLLAARKNKAEANK